MGDAPIVHQLKNQLSVVITLCEMLMMDLPDGHAQSDVRQIHEATTIALSLVQRMRDEGNALEHPAHQRT
jgi:hypothetical protein